MSKRKLVNTLLKDTIKEDFALNTPIKDIIFQPHIYSFLSDIYDKNNGDTGFYSKKQSEKVCIRKLFIYNAIINKIYIQFQKSIHQRSLNGLNYKSVYVYPAASASASSRLSDFANGNIRTSIDSGERTYWRCYFNAISCF